MMTGLGMAFGGFGLIGMLLIPIALIAGIVWLIRTAGGAGVQGPAQAQRMMSAREILDQRYARGEISREQYEAMKRDLQ